MAAVTESRHMEAWSQSSVDESFESSQHDSLSQDQSDNQWHLVLLRSSSINTLIHLTCLREWAIGLGSSLSCLRDWDHAFSRPCLNWITGFRREQVLLDVTKTLFHCHQLVANVKHEGRNDWHLIYFLFINHTLGSLPQTCHVRLTCLTDSSP